jgi:hypothetical protein
MRSFWLRLLWEGGMPIPAPTRLEQQLRRQRQMQQEQHDPYSDRGKALPPRQDQAQPDGTSSQAQQRHSANQ